MSRFTEQERLVKIETDIDYIKRDAAEMKEMMQGFIEAADKKYARKELENWFYAACALILSVVIYAGLRLVLIKGG
jgi:hypothetical protein